LLEERKRRKRKGGEMTGDSTEGFVGRLKKKSSGKTDELSCFETEYIIAVERVKKRDKEK